VSPRTICALLPALLFLCGSALSQAPVHYIISLASPERHLVRVTMEIPSGPDSQELQLPVWNALYQVRDFAQYINWIRADNATGRPLELTALNESRWSVHGSERGSRIEYEVFADSPDPYGAQLNTRHAFLNLAEILLYADGERGSPAQVEFRDLPNGWKIAAPLEQKSGSYSAKNYDQLVDSPVEISDFGESDFSGTCGTYRVIIDPSTAIAQLPRLVPSIQRIVNSAVDWMQDCPLKSYIFIYHVSDSPGGGMEHANATAITLPQRNFSGDLDSFTSITAHEFFHLWNVKRVRPQSLEPVDYTRENFTTSLWFSEGVDSTVGEYFRLRAGVLDERHYLAHLSQEITELQNRPAHLQQSAEQSSLDAWLEKYPYYNLPSRSISYYNKGELLGVMLDLAMRDASNDHASLRDLFHWMNDYYAKQGKFFTDSAAVRKAAENLSHADLRTFFEKYVSGTAEIPWDDFFRFVGLRLLRTEVIVSDPGFEAAQRFDQPPAVVTTTAGGEAERAGLRPEDIILQVNGKSPARNFSEDIAGMAPKSTLHLVVRRGNQEYRLQWKLGTRSATLFHLVDLADVTSQQKTRRTSWLFGEGAPRQ
jgi:predicted metalloprotease with PDZ domain